jgi:hypothetical protein
MKNSKGEVTSSMPDGFKDKVSYPQDNAGNMKLPEETGCKMGGSVTNLSHSLSGASAVQKG